MKKYLIILVLQLPLYVLGQTPAECFQKGEDYYNAQNGVKRDNVEAAKWYTKAAEQGYAPAQYKLGVCYNNGQGVTKDYKEAFIWYRKAADQGYASAMNNIGFLYEYGKGVPQDYQAARKWYQIALNKAQNFIIAKENLARVEKKIAELANNNNNYAQNTTTTTQLKVEPKPKVDSIIKNRPKVEPQVENTFVVIFSNENYKYEQSVPYALRDGQEFKKCCESTLGIPSEHIHYNQDVTRNEMMMELNWLEQTMQAFNGKARAIVYYSGHGMPSEDGKKSYLLPVDGNSRLSISGYCTEDLYKQLEKMPSAGTLVLLDACFSGAKRDGQMLSASRGVAIKVRDISVSGNVVVFSAAKGDETAYPFEKEKHGIFTYYLLKSLQEKNGTIPLGQLCDEVTENVKKNSVIVNSKSQIPIVTASRKASDWRDWILISKTQDTYINPEELIKEREERLKRMDKDLNTAWFVFGSRMELKEHNIFNSGRVLHSNFDKDHFTKIDIRIDKVIKLYSSSAEILTNHPASSYTLKRDAKNQYVLYITDPQSFWSVSKYLVVQTR